MSQISKGVGIATWIALLMSLETPVNAEETTSAVPCIDLRTATAGELETLPGIGPSRAAAIIAHRSRRPFNRVGDLIRVKGIGRKTLKRLRPYLTVGPARCAAAPPPRTEIGK